MEMIQKLTILTIILASFSAFSITTATTVEEAASSSSSTLLPPASVPHSTADPLTGSHILAPVLTHLSMDVPSLSSSSSSAFWAGPFTVFAHSDASIQTSSSCTVPPITQERIVRGVFTLHYHRSLAFGTKIETIVPGRCATVTSAMNSTKIFVERGVEITHPDLFNKGLIAVNGLNGYVTHLSPFLCNIERMPSLSSFSSPQRYERAQALSQYPIMSLMLSDAMLHITGFSIIAWALLRNKSQFPLFFTMLLLLRIQNVTASYDYLQLVMQYQPYVCQFAKDGCKQNPDNVFSIHGLWPTNYTRTVADCQGTPFNYNLVREDQRLRLKTYWPNVYDHSKNVDFWKNQWQKHGTCAESDSTQKLGQNDYLELALTHGFAMHFKLTKNVIPKGILVTTTSIEIAVYHATYATPSLRCQEITINGRKEFQLVEIVICVDKGTLRIVTCNLLKASKTCLNSKVYF